MMDVRNEDGDTKIFDEVLGIRTSSRNKTVPEYESCKACHVFPPVWYKNNGMTF